MPFSRTAIIACLAAILVSGVISRPVGTQSTSAAPNDSPFRELRWRSVGPHRGGRTKAITGVRGRPGLFYIGVVNGGVLKTEDYGRTWTPIFDDQPTASIGDVAVAPSNPDIIYVTSGEGLHRPDLSVGNGVYKSTDGGRTWTHLGLRDGQQIPRVVVDPRNPDRLFVAVLGHPYGPNEGRGVFRSADGGRTFEKVLYKDENTGASELEIDPSNPDVIYAGLWEAREGPWENGSWDGNGGGLFKSTDGGTTWKPLTRGFEESVGQIDLAIAPGNPQRLYASVAFGRATGIFRSDDAGESWTRITTDTRPAARIGGGDLPVLAVDPKNPDVVYSASVVMWKSTDGGKTWTGIRGAPGGDDYQRLWIDPDNPDVIGTASDQGAVISVTGGRTWSSWYTQATAQLYHVAADTAFPYRLCSGQQESGSACVASRGDDGAVTFREWHPVGVDEYGYAAPDPLNPDIVYGGRNVTRYDRRTGQVQTVGPAPGRGGGFRVVRTQPVVFSAANPRLLYYSSNVVWRTANGGATWTQISPDLTRKTWDVPANVGKYRDSETARATQRGVVYTVAPSPMAAMHIWAGTDDGLIHVTKDGGLNWKDVTPPEQKPWAKVSLIDAGHFDLNTAYAAINTLRLDDLRPHIYRTHDGGATWTHITQGIPEDENVNVVREDPVRKGLLYAGTERGVHVSFDDGEHWQSLRLNLPATSVRDLIVKGDDLAIATHGRGFWILDDVTPLRQWTAEATAAEALLFKPQDAHRVRWNMNTDTPLPADEPRGQNPPDGAVINYWLKSDASAAITLEVLDGRGGLVRKYSSDERATVDPNPPVPAYWYRPPQALASNAGLHRFMWDMHYTPTAGGRGGLPISATPYNTVPAPTSPWVAPGTYTVRLTVKGKAYSQPLVVKMDPRVKTPAAGILQQSTLSKRLYDGIVEMQTASQQVRELRQLIGEIRPKAPQSLAQTLAAFDETAAALAGAAPGGRGAVPGGGRGGASAPDTLLGASGAASQAMSLLQGADRTPTAAVVALASDAAKALAAMRTKLTALKADLAKVNAQLKAAGLPEMTLGR